MVIIDVGNRLPPVWRFHLYKNAINSPASKVHGANMGPIWGRQDPGGPHAGPINFAIWAVYIHDLFDHNGRHGHTFRDNSRELR